MGKIFSAPKAPTPTYTAPTQSTSTTTSTTTEETKEPSADEVRLQNILNRRRGRLGTVATSLGGVLSTTTNAQSTGKTLLGE